MQFDNIGVGEAVNTNVEKSRLWLWMSLGGTLFLIIAVSIFYFLFYRTPDLSISINSIRVFADKDQKFTELKYTVKNSGPVAIPADFEINVLESDNVMKSEVVKGLGANEERSLSSIIMTRAFGETPYQIAIDPKKMIKEFHRTNNRITETVNVPPDLPDLVLKDISFNKGDGYLYIEYCNNWTGTSSQTFLISASTDSGFFGGNSFYPFSIPQPGTCTKGALTPNLIGVSENQTKEVAAVIDRENEVTELTKENNSLKKTIEFKRNLDACIDSDGGQNHYQSGSANIWHDGGTGTGQGDCCIQEPRASCVKEGPYLREGICFENQPSEEIYKCPKGCLDGACIR